MALRFTIHRRLLLLSLCGLAFTLLMGAAGLYAVDRLGDARDAIGATTRVLKSQMDADMMHDALRGDVLAALLAGSQRRADAEAEVTKDLAAHAKQLRESFAEVQRGVQDAGLREQAARLQPRLEAYAGVAAEVVALAWKDPAAAAAREGAFKKAFDELETAMGELDDVIEKDVERTRADSEAASASLQHLIAVSVLLAAAVLIGVGRVIGASVVKPLREAVQLARAVAAGDLGSRIERARRDDEIGELLTALADMNQHLVQIVGTVRSGSEAIATGTGEIVVANNDLCSRTESQASALQQTAASMEQINGTTQQSAETARRASELAAEASRSAAHGGDVVGRVVQTMGEISSSSQRIADIIGTIDGIAFQTNILALNAAVEAARAGEQGRGFAVVAGEVRALAQRSAGAAREIKSLIGASVEKVDTGTRLVDEAGHSIGALVQQVERVNALIGEISGASGEQGRGFAQINQAVAQLDHATQQNAALVEQTAAAAESLKTQARSLVDVVARFRLA